MDTKLKNYRKLTCIIIGIIILLPSLAMMVLRPHYIRQQQELDAFPYSYRDISNFLVEASYVLHAEEIQSESDTSLSPYEIFISQSRPIKTASDEQEEKDTFTEDTYPEDEDEATVSEEIDNLYSEWSNNFSYFRSYLEYEVLDESRIIDSNRSASSLSSSSLCPMLCLSLS